MKRKTGLILVAIILAYMIILDVLLSIGIIQDIRVWSYGYTAGIAALLLVYVVAVLTADSSRKHKFLSLLGLVTGLIISQLIK